MGISFEVGGSYKQLEAYLQNASKIDIVSVMHSCGQEGVQALSSHTPIETGLTAASWGYNVKVNKGRYTLTWTNTDVENGFPVAIMLQYGYGTGTGGYVAGRDYINPVIKPIFDRLAATVWKAVTSA